MSAPLSSLDHYFLQTSLANLSAHNCVIPVSRREDCRVALEGALRGAAPVVDAAAALMKGHEDNIIRKLDGGLLDPEGRPIPLIEKVARFPLKEIYRRFGETHRAIGDFLSGNPAAGDLETTEVTFLRDFDPADSEDFITVRRNKRETAVQVIPYYMTHLRELWLSELFRSLIHPPGSRIWRYLPLQLLVGAVRLTCDEDCVGIQFGPYPLSREEYVALWSEGKKPLCIGSKPSPGGPDFLTEEGDMSHPGLFRLGGGTGMIQNGLYVAYHDLWHILDWSLASAEARRMPLLLSGCLTRVEESLPSVYRGHWIFDWMRGELFHFPMSKDFLFQFIGINLGAHEAMGELPKGLMDRFLDELRTAHPAWFFPFSE